MLHEELLGSSSGGSGIISRTSGSGSTNSRYQSSESDGGFDDAAGWNAGMCAEMEYHELFEGDEPVTGSDEAADNVESVDTVRRRLAQDYDASLRDTQPDWRWILTWLTECPSSNEVTHSASHGAADAAAPLPTPTAAHTVCASTAAVPPQPNAPGSAFIEVVQSDDGQRWRLLESPATRRLKALPPAPSCTGALFPIDVTWNRKDVQKRIRDHDVLQGLVDVDNVYVGYHFRDSAGLALVLFDGSDCDDSRCRAEMFLSALASSSGVVGRILQRDADDDLRPFYKVDRIKDGAVLPPPPHATLRADAQTTHNASLKLHTPITLYQAMRDVKTLNAAVEASGGIHGCRFVAFDCEAAVVSKGSVALPVEMSFVDCLGGVLLPGERPCPAVLHMDPGLIDDDDALTSRKLSTCGVPGGHGLPIRNYTFLRRDYATMVDKVHSLLFQQQQQQRAHASLLGDDAPSAPPVTVRRTILVNKGSTMDLQAIRWLYAADAATRGYHQAAELHRHVPHPEDILMFDVACVQEALGVDLEASPIRRYGGAATASSLEASIACAKEDVGRCWYHGEVRDIFPAAHCAAKDARALAAVVGRWLQ